MAEREHILIGLVKEVLGPRHGYKEVLPYDQNPRDEYITGVLAPELAVGQPDLDGEVDELLLQSDVDQTEETSAEEDQDTQGFAAVPGAFTSPALDPRLQPRSIGLSFVIEVEEGTPYIEICATWARYREIDQKWERHPDYILLAQVAVTERRRTSAQLESKDDVSLRMRSSLIPGTGNRWKVWLYLVNGRVIPDKGKPITFDFVFQPQIRVNCVNGTRPVPVQEQESYVPGLRTGVLAEEEASLTMLYRERTAFARGHMCGATWREIDPERSHPRLPSPSDAPFAWTDRWLLAEEVQKQFSPADVRTEIVPVYPIGTPKLDWNSRGPAPILSPELLAETWSSVSLEAALRPLIAGYQAWIDAQYRIARSLPEGMQQVARGNIATCEETLQRLGEAIDLLTTDETARLAFCFANKAIALQAKWAGKKLVWRPFQLAFILLNVVPLVDPLHETRKMCDLLWIPTGGGKTESYLGLTAFTLALRRLQAREGDSTGEDCTGAGVGVISRYTLRLLTIQQFRRALGLITACEMLRVQNLEAGSVGWRPADCSREDNWLWGGTRFSAGLWVGSGVTPNGLFSIKAKINDRFTIFPGALDILKDIRSDYNGPDMKLRKETERTKVESGGEPAQVLSCPCCAAMLAVPNDGLAPGRYTMHFTFTGGRTSGLSAASFDGTGFSIIVEDAQIAQMAGMSCRALTMTLLLDKRVEHRQFDSWWYENVLSRLGEGATLLAARPARAGYLILNYENSRDNSNKCDFEIYCPSPTCDLNNRLWAEQVPLARSIESVSSDRGGLTAQGWMAKQGCAALPGDAGWQWQDVPTFFQPLKGREVVAGRMPVPAYTTDDQVYHRCPSLLIATVDKFARLAHEGKASSIFGNVEFYHSRWGYYREGCPPHGDSSLATKYKDHPSGHSRGNALHTQVPAFAPPDLILQDELHLIEGPLGSMVGLYETVIDLLCQRPYKGKRIGPKYIASTATVRQAATQVRALFNRELAQFPPSAVNASDRFFALDSDEHPLDSELPGRLYVAICAPGKGAQTPIVRMWSGLMQTAFKRRAVADINELDRYWTLVGYFNAIRELAGALALYRQDITEWIKWMRKREGGLVGQDGNPDDQMRQLTEENRIELSSRVSSTELPSRLEVVGKRMPSAVDAVFSTSMFGTGVDIDRLGLMVVHGQPKTTAAYIQATGRVGRQGGGLVVTFFRAGRPRDLDHYEFFTGYHRALYRYVEPITVAPFSPRARERALGPLSVILLRHGRNVAFNWRIQQRLMGAYHARPYWMADHRRDREVELIPDLLEARAATQPEGRRPPAGVTRQESSSELDRWAAAAREYPDADKFVYHESSYAMPPSRHVILGDPQHRIQGLTEVYENAPQSLREVEETTGFRD